MADVRRFLAIPSASKILEIRSSLLRYLIRANVLKNLAPPLLCASGAPGLAWRTGSAEKQKR